MCFQYYKINITSDHLNDKKIEIEKEYTSALAMGRGVLHLDLLDDLGNGKFGSILESSALRFLMQHDCIL